MNAPRTPDWLWHHLATPLGTLWLAASRQGLAGVWFAHQRHAPQVDEDQRRSRPAWARDAAGSNAAHTLERAEKQLTAYFVQPAQDFDLPLDPSRGTDFQRAVWQALRTIAPGRALSYAGLAERIGRPQAVRAVGAAVGRNPWSIVVPCHRVLGTNGSLTGYAGGLERKLALLRLEGITPLSNARSVPNASASAQMVLA
jgi:methylated-DNA-[protein]-cysteine S-methyltransferase